MHQQEAYCWDCCDEEQSDQEEGSGGVRAIFLVAGYLLDCKVS
jgi:hypothetical protein